MKCIFISNALNEQLIRNNHIDTISYADNLAQTELIKILHEKYKDDLIVITAAYNNFKTYKHHEEIIQIENTKSVAVKNNSTNKYIYYLTIILGYYKKLKFYLKKYKNEKIIVITNGPHIFRSLPIYLTKRKYQYKFVPFLLGGVELPEYTGISKILSNFSKKALKLADGSIVYVPFNATDYTNKPYVEILYSISDTDKEKSKQIYQKKKSKTLKKTIFYAGALNDINSFGTVMELIKKIPPHFKFLICGDGKYKEELQKLVTELPEKLIFLGKISHNRVIELEHQSDYLIILRNTKTKIGKYHSKYSTSSKLLEYLLSGTPIIVNEHEAIPKEILPYLNLLKDESTESVLDFLNNSHNQFESHLNKAVLGREYVIKTANYKIQGDKIVKFLDKL